MIRYLMILEWTLLLEEADLMVEVFRITSVKSKYIGEVVIIRYGWWLTVWLTWAFRFSVFIQRCCDGGSFRMGESSSHCGDIVGVFCDAGVYSGGLDSLQILYFSST